jgi:MoaA/NifB/PqqE/SkfB family radical SAM enzyme
MGTPKKMTAAGRAKAAARKVRELALVARRWPLPGIRSWRRLCRRFCNLSCAYCNEYDKVSEPVPVAEMERRIDHLGRLGTSIITISGGEPLTHPELDDVIRRMRKVGAMAGMITNGYLLNVERIERLNQAGLDHMQISIDNIEPGRRLEEEPQGSGQEARDARRARRVPRQHQLGRRRRHQGSQRRAGDLKRALELGFSNTIGIIHDGSGQLKPLQPEEAKIYFEVRNLERRNYSRFNQFQEAIAQGKPNDWRCRAGSRYLYICEDGLVHYCSQQRGFPGVPIAEYTTADVKREFLTAKSCSPNCTISCVHQISYIDHWRAPQTHTISPGGQGAS